MAVGGVPAPPPKPPPRFGEAQASALTSGTHNFSDAKRAERTWHFPAEYGQALSDLAAARGLKDTRSHEPKELTPLVHLLAETALSMYGVQPATACAGVFDKLAQELYRLVPRARIVGGDGYDGAKKIATRVSAFRRGGEHGKVVSVNYIPVSHWRSPLHILKREGKIVAGDAIPLNWATPAPVTVTTGYARALPP